MQKVTGYIFGTIWWGFGLNLIAYFIASHVRTYIRMHVLIVRSFIAPIVYLDLYIYRLLVVAGTFLLYNAWPRASSSNAAKVVPAISLFLALTKSVTSLCYHQGL